MRKTRMLGATGTALVAALGAGACYDFDGARQRCSDEGRCEPNVAACTPVPGEDLPDDAFADTDCDGVDGQADAGLFIDPMDGDDDAGVGTRQAPLRTVGRALAMLRELDGGPRHLFLAGGAYDEADLVLDVPVSLHGGYAGRSGGWRRAANRVAMFDAGTLGLTVQGLQDAGVLMEYVQISAATAAGPGEPSIAVRMVDSSGVRLRHVTLAAGAGGRGAPGEAGDAGLGGPDGGEGGDGLAGYSDPGQGGTAPPITCPDGIQPTGGSGVIGSSGGTPGRDGGTGGPGEMGGAGGAGGEAPDAACSRFECVCNPFPGERGQGGAEGSPGTPGDGGAGMGVLRDGTWVAEQQGESGGGGTAGSGGGGGGSGGSCRLENTIVAGGGGSGAGGAGGCGGEGGRGGGGGGASISLLLIGSQAAMEEGSVLRTLGGGPGGEGGEGGTGGPGGAGGHGGNGGQVVRDGGVVDGGIIIHRTTGGEGGEGGEGGAGGAGGGGGGGGGGPSVGVWCGPGATVRYTDGGVTFQVGPGGPGGAGPGLDGSTGEQLPDFNCVSANP
ncbi:DUF1565 domain-containing protein [Myxococcus xanthus]|uniref:DUF1565 domain-containing protein n=1 Tax=Myxococcus xanthus TaxID=34 RepID=UPI001CED4FF1|nr:DUF1565 domain-containing protein [Myxococcus xanthus]